MDKKNIVPKIFDAKGDLKKRWYIEYVQDGSRHRIYGEINRCKDIDSRNEAIRVLLETIKLRLIEKKGLEEELLEIHAKKSVGLRKKSVQTNFSKINIFLEFAKINKIQYVYQVDKQGVQKFFLYLGVEKKLHTTSMNAYHQVLASHFKQLGNNAFEVFKRYKKSSTPATTFQEHEVERLRDAISVRDPQLWLFIRFIFNCLIRPNSELRLLKVRDIIFAKGQIRIKPDINKNKKQQFVVIPDDFLKDLLYLKQYPPNYYLFSKKGVPDNKGVGYNYFYNHHVKFLKALGFTDDKYELYSWKHTGAVAMVQNNVPMKQIQMQGRWHSLDQLDAYLRALGINDMPDVKKFKSL